MTEDELFDLLTAIEERVPLEEKPAWFEREAHLHPASTRLID